MNRCAALLSGIMAIALCFWSSASAAEMALVQEGMRGEYVRHVQELLKARNLFFGEADGICGELTVEAIRKFQESVGLEADGICGAETYSMLKGQSSSLEIDGDSAVMLKQGMDGADVYKLQELLFKHGYLITKPDGIYGTMTETAVKNFQRDIGLAVDGVCSSETFDRLRNRNVIEIGNGLTSIEEHSLYAAPGEVIKPGMHGDGVILLQEYLIDFGYLIGNADGLFGPNSVDALKRFQADNGLETDGICGSDTYAALNIAPSAKKTNPASNGRYIISGRMIRVVATAYSAMQPGMSLYTATGKFARRGIIAVDPEIIPLGTRVYIPGYGIATAEDTGSSIRGNRIDIVFDTLKECYEFGRQNIDIYILD